MALKNRAHQGKRYVRPGFTLIEVVTSLAIMSVLMLGLSGAVMIGSHAVPTATDTGIIDQAVMNVANQIRTELRSCSKIKHLSNASSMQIQLTMKATGSVGAPSDVSYTYSGTDDTLSRKVDSLDDVVVLSGMSVCVLSVTKDGTDASSIYLFMAVDDTIQGLFEMHVSLPDKPEAN